MGPKLGAPSLLVEVRRSGLAAAAPSTWRRATSPALEDLLGDDEALDLRGALVDLEDLRVAHQLLDRVLARVAVAAEDLHGVERRLHGGVGGERLGEGGL